MKTWAIAAVAVLAGSFLGVGDVSAADGSDADVECLVMSFLLVTNPDEKIANAGQLQGMFFAGKLDGQLSETELEQRIIAMAPGIDEPWLRRNTIRCATELGNKGQELISLGERLEAAAKNQ